MQLDDLLRQPKALPVLPEVAARIIATFEDDEVDFNRVATEVERDPAIAARVLQQANSSLFRLLRPVSTVRDAVSILGLNKLRALVVAAALNNSYRSLVLFPLTDFWRYSFGAATVARLVCANRRLDENMAFTAALLHGMGELVMHMGMPKTMQRVNERCGVFALQRADVQYELLDYSYAEVGAALAQHWRLPKIMGQAIAHHARPLEGEEQEPMAAIVHMAAWRSRVWVSGNAADDLIHTYPDAVGLVLELDPDVLVAPDLPELAALDA